METKVEHLMIIDYKAARHFISRLHVIYFIVGLKYANNAFNIMFPVSYIFTLSTKIAYCHSKSSKKGTAFPQINMSVVSIILVVIFAFVTIEYTQGTTSIA